MRTLNLLLILATSAVPVSAAFAGEVERIDGPNGVQPNLPSDLATVSADGRFVAFTSRATNLVPNDTNGTQDVFLKDRQTGAVTLVSKSTAGVQANSTSVCPVISADGRYVAFECFASNLHPLAQNLHPGNVYVHDTQTGVTDVVNVGLNGQPADWWAAFPTISGDGRYVAFYSAASNLVPNDAPASFDLFLTDRGLGTTVRITETAAGVAANATSWYPNVSADGRYVAFISNASNLVANDLNGLRDVFRWDRTTGIIDLVSVSNGGAQANANCEANGIGFISGDGRHVTFSSQATSLVAGDTNGVEDVFVRDVVAGTTSRVTPNTSNGDSRWPVVSQDGRFVAYESRASSLVPSGTILSDVYEYDSSTKTTRRLSQVSATVGGNDESFAPAISADGHWVVYYSRASNLVSSDTNGFPDLFLHSECWAAGATIGQGLAGTGGAVPALGVDAGPCAVKSYALTASNVVGGAAGLLLYGVGEKVQSAFGGTVYVDVALPHAWAPIMFGGPAGSAGAGQFTVDDLELGRFAGQSFVIQALAADPAAPTGVSLTNAVRLDVGF